MLRRLIAREYDLFWHEGVEDYVAKRRGGAETVYIQVKHRQPNCFLRRPNLLAKVFDHFGDIVAAHCDGTTEPCEFVLVYNEFEQCRTCDCIDRARKLPSFQRLQDAIETSGARNVLVNFERFLRLPIASEDIRSEIARFGQQGKELVSYLTNDGRVQILVSKLAAIVTSIDDALVRLEGRPPTAVDRTLGRQRLIQAIDSTVGRSWREAEDAANSPARATAQAAAATTIRVAFFDHPLVLPQTDVVQMACATEQECLRSLEVVHALQAEDENFFWNARTRTFRRGETYVLQQPRGALRRIDDFGNSDSHFARVQTIRTLIHNLATWSKAGVFLYRWRADRPRYAHLYLAEPTNGAVLADVGALRLYDPNQDGLIGPQYARGPVLAKAIMQIYYGSADIRRLRRTELFEAPWNDNIVLDLARWLERSFPYVNDLDLMTARLFESEAGPPPIFVHSLDDRFLRDCLNNNVYSTASALAFADVSRVSLNLAGKHRKSWIVSGPNAQIEMTSLWGGFITARQYIMYNRRRWQRHRGPDKAESVDIAPGFLGKPVPLMHVSSFDFGQRVARHVFGIPEASLRQTQSPAFDRASEHAKRLALPPLLESENGKLEAERVRLDSLRSREFEYLPHSEDGDEITTRIVVQPAPPLLQHLKEHGFVHVSRDLGLRVICHDGRRRPTRFNVSSIGEDGGKAVISVVPLRTSSPLDGPGILELSDAGSQKVIRNDQAAINAVKLLFERSLEAEPASTSAWNALHELVGSDAFGMRPPEGLWGFPQPSNVCTETAAPTGLTHLGPSHLHSGAKWIVTGAPRTGKTCFAVKTVLSLLERLSHERQCPPPRVVVVAASHYALDNFTRVLLTLGDDRVVPYRHVPMHWHRRAAKRRNADVDLYRYLWGRYEPDIKSLLFECSAELDAGREGRTKADIQNALLALRRAKTRTDAPVVPSHARWRRERLGEDPAMAPGVHDRMVKLLEERLRALNEYSQRGTAVPDVPVYFAASRGGQ